MTGRRQLQQPSPLRDEPRRFGSARAGCVRRPIVRRYRLGGATAEAWSPIMSSAASPGWLRSRWTGLSANSPPRSAAARSIVPIAEALSTQPTESPPSPPGTRIAPPISRYLRGAMSRRLTDLNATSSPGAGWARCGHSGSCRLAAIVALDAWMVLPPDYRPGRSARRSSKSMAARPRLTDPISPPTCSSMPPPATSSSMSTRATRPPMARPSLAT